MTTPSFNESFSDTVSEFETALKNTAAGVYADQSTIWNEFLANRSNFPTLTEIKNFLRHDTPFISGVGAGKAMTIEDYETKLKVWVERYGPWVSAEEINAHPEPNFGNPTILDMDGYTTSFLYIKNYALAGVIEDALRAARPEADALKVLEIGAGYGGVAQVLLERGVAASYTIVDLPPNLFLSMNFLRGVFPDKSASIVDRGQQGTVPTTELRSVFPNDIELLDEKFDLVINSASLGEMPSTTARAYVAWISEHLAPDGVFVSHNTDRARNAGDVIQRHSDYGFERFALAYAKPQPATPGLLHRQHLVLALTNQDGSNPPVDNRRLDQMSALVTMGLHEEVDGLFASVAGASTPAQQQLWSQIDAQARHNTLEGKIQALAARTDDRDCNAVLDLIAAAMLTSVQHPNASESLKTYLTCGRSLVALCLAAGVAAHRPDFHSNPSLQAARDAVLAKVPRYLANQVDDLGYDSALFRMCALLG